MLRLPLLPHKDTILVGTIAILTFMLWQAGQGLERLQAQLDARPLVTDHKVDARTEDYRRGPTKTVRKTVVAPDGTKTTETTREVAAEERHTEAKTETLHTETPIALPQAPARTRYVGLALNPFHYTRPRLSAGLTFWDGRLDAGAYWDSKLPWDNGAFGAETRYRF